MRVAWTVLLLVIAGAACAELQPVDVLEHTDNYAVLGNDRFSVRIERTGKLGPIRAGDLEYLWMGSLYTTPIVPETGKGLRAVQAENGLGAAPPMPEPVRRGDYCEVAISYDAARDELYGGEPLYHFTQEIQVHPGGWIRLWYRFDWKRLFSFRSASLYLALSGEGVDRARFSADYTGHVSGGVFDVAAGTGRIETIRGAVRALTVDCEAGPLLLSFEDVPRVTAQFWGGGRVAIILDVPGVGRSVPMYPGTSSEMQVDLKLPVSH
ncbi:MAG: hypothetical protein J7M38_12405 [Armatimonadetes bacterium]|nr:hypothetical protein [Armatimonadota bacterium]